MTFQKRVWQLSSLIVILLALFSLRILYWQMFRGNELQSAVLDPLKAAAEYAGQLDSEGVIASEILDEQGRFEGLENLPQPVLQRTLALLQNISRGSIYDRNGTILAEELVDEEGNRTRYYHDPSLAHVIGYTSALRTGLSGLERSYNETLLGVNRLDAQFNQAMHQPITGSDLILTIDSSLQQLATELLGSRAGSIIVMDGESGAVLAMVSYPRFDPNQILQEGYASSLLANCGDASNCQAPFLNRSTQALYSPGSTFKTVALIAALDTQQVNPQTMFDFGEPVQGENGPYYVYEVDGGIIPDPNHREDRLSLPMAYAKSANAAFARIGHEMAPQTMISYAQRLGFSMPEGKEFPLEIEYTPSRLANDLDSIRENNLLRAATAIGQGELQANPLNIGMTVLAVINQGDMPVPYFVQAVRHPNGQVVERLSNRRVIRNLMRDRTAEQVRDMMITVVEEGSASLAAIPNITVGGKTGTAQLGGEAPPHAWFAGFADNGEKSVVITVVIENGGSGATVATPIFAQLAAAALDVSPQPASEVVPTPTPLIEEPTPTPTNLPTVEPTLTPVQAGAVPQPDITRDPTKRDITAEQSSCPINEDPPVGSGQFIWPSQYQALSGGNFREGHPGFDLSSPPNAPVYAADHGLVIFAGWSGVGYGNTVLIDHGNGYQTLYAHLNQVSTFCGADVKSGQIIGLSGNTGNSTGPHLHFEVRVPGGFIDPIKVLPTP